MKETEGEELRGVVWGGKKKQVSSLFPPGKKKKKKKQRGNKRKKAKTFWQCEWEKDTYIHWQEAQIDSRKKKRRAHRERERDGETERDGERDESGVCAATTNSSTLVVSFYNWSLLLVFFFLGPPPSTTFCLSAPSSPHLWFTPTGSYSKHLCYYTKFLSNYYFLGSCFEKHFVDMWKFAKEKHFIWLMGV